MSDIPYPLADRTAGITARLAHLRTQIAAWFWGWRSPYFYSTWRSIGCFASTARSAS